MLKFALAVKGLKQIYGSDFLCLERTVICKCVKVIASYTAKLEHLDYSQCFQIFLIIKWNIVHFLSVISEANLRAHVKSPIFKCTGLTKNKNARELKIHSVFFLSPCHPCVLFITKNINLNSGFW